MKPQKCKVCDRDIIAHNKGNTIIYGHYCSRYCKIFDREGLKMINGAEKHGKSQYEGFNYWPKITISCDTCQGDVTLDHSKEGDDRAFCCRKCHIKVKTCRKNAMKDYTILKILRERPDGLPNDEIAYLLGTVHQHRCNPYQISSLLKRWIAYGVVTKEKPSAKSRTIYRLSKEYQNKPLGDVVIKFRTPKAYAERTY